MTNLELTFNSPNSIKVTPTGNIPYTIEKFLNTTTSLSFKGELLYTVITGSNSIDYTLSDGLYKITNTTDSSSHTFLIYDSILNALDIKVRDVLLNKIQQTTFPNNYDFTLLSLISILIIGNNDYQNKEYNIANLSDYLQIVLAFDKSYKYMDLLNNTPQSINSLLM